MSEFPAVQQAKARKLRHLSPRITPSRICVACVVLSVIVVTVPVSAFDTDKMANCNRIATKLVAGVEREIWRNICLGLPARFASSDRPEISPEFLRTIISEPPFRSMITTHGVHIISVQFSERVNLSGEHLEWPLRLVDSVFKEGLNIARLRTDINAYISLTDSTFKDLNASSANIGGDLIVDRGNLGDVDLRHAKIGGHLTISGAQVGNLLMDSASINGHLHACNSEFLDADLRGLNVLGHLNLTNSRVTYLIMDWAVVGGSAFLRKGGCEIPARRTHWPTTDRATYANVDFIYSTIKGNLDLSNGTFKCLRFTGTTVHGELTLEREIIDGAHGYRTEWPDSSDPRGCPTYAHEGDGEVDKRSSNLELDGLTYGRIRGPKDNEINYYVEWLSRDVSFSPQPYMELVALLRSTGLSDGADDVMFAGKKAEMDNSTGAYWFGLQLLRFVVGYGVGYRIFRVLYFFGVLVFVGTVTILFSKIRWRIRIEEGLRKVTLCESLRRIGRMKVTEYLSAFWYSVDYALPVMKLDERHFRGGDMTRGVRQYFLLHQIVGYLLIFFTIVGLTGLVN